MTALDPTDAETEQAFHLERRGIDHVPDQVRWGRPRDLGAMWAGSSVQFEYFVYGAVLMSFGFTFAQAVALILLGNLSFLLLGICSAQGPQAGTTVFGINRAPFGPNGSRLIALFNWATQVGFETEGLVLIVYAAIALAAKGGLHSGTGLKVVFILAAAAIQMILPLLGHATVMKVLRALIIPFVILYVILAALTLGKAHLGAVHHGADWQTFMAGLAFVIALSGLGWVENGNDFSRYLPADADRGSIVAWVAAGAAIPEILMMLLGAAVATYASAVGTDANPIQAFPHVFAAWFLVPFLIVVVLQLFAINSLDLYSSGVTLQAIGLRLRRWQAVLVDTVIAGGLTAYAIFSSSFTTLLTDFVDCVIVWIAPWTAIFLVDWILRRYRYVPGELQKEKGGLYWRNGGIHWPAIIAQVVGMFASLMGLSQTFFHGLVASHTGNADFSVFLGLGVGGVLYAVLAGRSVRREAAEQVGLLEAAPDGP